MEKYREAHKDLHMFFFFFFNLQKAYDKVPKEIM